MSLDLHIKIIFSYSLDNKAINSLVSNALALGCVFYKNNSTYLLSLQEIVTIFYEGYKLEGHGGSLYVYNDSSEFMISIYQEKKDISALSLHLTGSYWKKQPSTYNCDFDKYIRFLLNITAKMPIKSIAILVDD